MKKLLKGGRVIDPANGLDGIVRPADRRRPRGRGRPRPAGRTARRSSTIPAGYVVCPGLDRHARAPARARPGAQGNGGDGHGGGRGRRVHGRRLHAQHHAGQRQRQRHGAHPGEGRRGQPGARLSDRRGVEGVGRVAAGRHRRAAAGRVRGHHRRRPPGGDGDADEARAGIRQHVRHAGDRALRGPDRSRATAWRTRAITPRGSGCAAFPARAKRLASSAACCWPS